MFSFKSERAIIIIIIQSKDFSIAVAVIKRNCLFHSTHYTQILRRVCKVFVVLYNTTKNNVCTRQDFHGSEQVFSAEKILYI